jgi:hypothetical protein
VSRQQKVQNIFEEMGSRDMASVLFEHCLQVFFRALLAKKAALIMKSVLSAKKFSCRA